MKPSTRAVLGTSALALFATAALGAAPAVAHDGDRARGDNGKAVTLKATLTELNSSGVSGRVTAVVQGETIRHIQVKAQGLSPDAPHAQHIHYGDQALNECPTLAQDANGDGRLNTLEGVPAYGPVVLSLTTFGSTSFTDVPGIGYGPAGGTAAQIAESIREGEGVGVIHGLDYDNNDKYSFSKEGASELDPSLPAEATDPAACGVLR